MIEAEMREEKLKLEVSGTFSEVMAEFTCIASALFKEINPEIPFEDKVVRFVAALTFGEKTKKGGHFHGTEKVFRD